jgi:hypothetical protein
MKTGAEMGHANRRQQLARTLDQKPLVSTATNLASSALAGFH